MVTVRQVLRVLEPTENIHLWFHEGDAYNLPKFSIFELAENLLFFVASHLLDMPVTRISADDAGIYVHIINEDSDE